MTGSFRDFGRKGNPRPCPLSDLYQGFPTEAALEAGKRSSGIIPHASKKGKDVLLYGTRYGVKRTCDYSGTL